ncbi:lysophospholipid acyltransferase family protein [Stigmatella aurantiaca]|uniref:1-acyl-sn-glycerol-3-phosphate acyltransferase n=1 Tax=Stigmatella aurantiaca (strain DW4/3-1) TaxID=378806 RepID=Q08YU6_STIAD|nr:lysophospholipid acyltransferase family protein [Stigmatella aurantiaca]ADO68506.1 Acyltransferase domain protein [Stigmatella aurantiaca DW4/3-1]EAU65681.1 1-acyl-sn-glycerol-3-phosphate acyltransferase [Stigmatella aurantiaca DW4/3-1]
MLTALFSLLALLPDRPRRAVVRQVIDRVWKRYADMQVHGREHLPLGPALYVCNHLSNADGLTLQRALQPLRIWFLAGVKLRRTAMTRLASEAVNTIFIRPGSPDIEALRRAVAALKEGRSVLVFPEGGRSRTGALLRAKKGVSLIAHRTGVPIVPVALTGTERLLPIDERNMGGERLHRARVTVRIGPPFGLEALREEVHGASDPRQALADAMMRRVAALLPPEYQGEYRPLPEARPQAASKDPSPSSPGVPSPH